jgi:DNA (cytosine-5)-methyltransferase 1
VELRGDIQSIKRLPKVDVVAAGFPCQDLSQAGRTAGIGGTQSGLVGEVFRLLGDEQRVPTWLLLENVPFMLQLDRGGAMRFLIDSLEKLGFSWAYRVIDTRSFGLPQRRQRVILLASQTEDPRPVLLAPDAGEPSIASTAEDVACGFYWTEGTRGLGWAVDAVPTLKGGSGLGIPSPPAICLPRNGGIVTPEIRDAERLQGFEADWTLPALQDGRGRAGARWKMVGNAVSVPVAEWIGHRLAERREQLPDSTTELTGPPWPKAAYGWDGERRTSAASMWPVQAPYSHLHEFLGFDPQPLSERATAGFLSRATQSSLRFPEGFLDRVRDHLHNSRAAA